MKKNVPVFICIKKTSLFLILFLTSVFASSQNYWINEAGNTGVDEALDISSDNSNNNYAIGYFSNSVTFGGTTLSSAGINDCYVAKTNNLGGFIWAIKLGGTSVDKGLSIKTDADGNSVVCGLYSATANFGLFPLTSAGLQDGFVAKINNLGVVLWATSLGGTENDIANSVSFDGEGNVLVTGQFKGTALFGGLSLTSALDPITMTSSIDIFTVKLNSTGTVQWAKQGKAKYTDRGIDVAADNAGNVYVTGQFSDTITFDLVHNNVANNSIFLVKYNASGVEQWFRQIGGSSLSIISGLAVDAGNNIFLTGDFESVITFFGTTDVTLNNVYDHAIFIAKYTGTGSVVWTTSSGSDSDLNSKNIVVDESSSAYITGNFECKLNAFAEVYGQGTFNSIGKSDVFTAKYTPAGAFDWGRNCGGLEDDFSYGITLNNTDNPVIAGSYTGSIIFPSFPTLNVISTSALDASNSNNGYCGDANYGSLTSITSAGSIDLFIGTFFEPTRSPFDFYNRSVGGDCNRDAIGVCIVENGLCVDTVKGCGSVNLSATNNTNPSPIFNYIWSNGTASSATSTSTGGSYWVKQTRADGCFVSYDTVFVIIIPLPDPISITDSKGININDFSPQEIKLCAPDSATLTAGNTDPYQVTWSNNLVPGNSTYAFVSGLYSCSYIDSNGCYMGVGVNVDIVEYIFPVPELTLSESENDTVSLCGGSFVQLTVLDSTELNNLCDPSTGTIISAEISPDVSVGFSNCVVYFTPPQDGYYTIEVAYLLDTFCQTDTFYDSKTVYVEIFELPEVTLDLTGESFFCFGDTITLTVDCSIDDFQWTGPPYILSAFDSIIYATLPGTYSASATITNEFGCTASASEGIVLANTPSPFITMDPSDGIICPNDSISIFVNLPGTYDWYGPEGVLDNHEQVIYVTTSGFYFCVVTTPNDCEVSSNTVEVTQYTTPYLTLFPSAVLCPDSSILVNVITTSNSNLQWQSPLSGSDLTQLIDQPGLYTCTVDACNIVTTLSVTVTESFVEALITTDGETILCEGDTIALFANAGYSYTWKPNQESSNSILVFAEGTYLLYCKNSDNCVAIDSIFISETVITPQPNIENNGPVCENEGLYLTTDILGNATYYWTGPNGFISNFANPFFENVTELQEGEYTLVMNEGECTSDTVTTQVAVDPAFQLNEITSNFPLCIGNELLLNVNYVENALYNWTGPNGFLSTAQNPVEYFDAQDTGTYYLEAIRGACKANEEIFVFGDDCNIGTINIFSPNGDGINDFFSFSKENLLNLQVDIYNRWGQLIYTWDNIDGSWDGTVLKSAKKASEGVYYYVASMLPRNGYLQTLTGYVHLVY